MSSETTVKVPVRNPIKPGESAPKAIAPMAAAVAPVAKPAQSLRAVQTARLTVDRFKETGHFAYHQQAWMKPDWDVSDALNPDFWSGVASFFQANPSAGISKDRLGTVVELIPEDHAFYAKVCVVGFRKNSQGVADGLYVTCIGPQCDPETGKMCGVDLKTGLPWKGRSSV